MRRPAASPISPAQRLEKAIATLRDGDPLGAERLVRALLDDIECYAPAWHSLGIIAARAGRDDDSVAALERAIAVGDAAQRARSGIALAEVHRRAARLSAAEGALRGVTGDAPSSADAWLRLGLLLREDRREGDAVAPLRMATALDPGLAVAHAALATALHAGGAADEAAAHAAHAVALAPDDPAFAATLAGIRNAQGRHAEAEALCRRGLASGREPTLLNTLGIACREGGKIDEAAKCFERALALRPDFVDALFNLATARKDQGRTDDAVALLRRVVALAPDLAAARIALCMAHLPVIYTDETEIDRRRADYSEEIEALIEHAEQAGTETIAPGVGVAQPFLLATQGRQDAALQARYGGLVCRAMAAAFPPIPLAPPPRAGERYRLGIVCGYFRDHSAWRMPVRGWVEGLDRMRFELIGYHTAAQRDTETDRAEALFDRFVQGPLPIAAWIDRISADRPHSLLYPEIGMDPMAARLAALRLAPAQYVSWGHPSTSGYPTIDHFLSSAEMEPPLGDAHYSERLVRLPGLSTPMVIPTVRSAAPSRAALGIPADAMVYWCGQSLHKYLPDHDDVLVAIAKEVLEPRFLFVEAPGARALTFRFRERLAAAFAKHGLDANRLCLFLPRSSPDTYRATIGCADAVLDSIGWSGCNTLLDALAHALPIVTLPGATMRSRHGSAILRTLGLERWISVDRADYVRIAATLATEKDGRAFVRTMLDTNRHRLEGHDAVAALEVHLLDRSPLAVTPDR